jgi:RNA polymerase sigma-70 factor (ECF subfamily)
MNQETSQERSAELLARIRTGDRKFLRELYEEHRQGFGIWISRSYKCDEDMAAEVYQQAFTTLYYNVKEGKLTKLTSSLKTYLFAIGRNLIRDHFKLTIRRQEIMEVAVDTGKIDNGILDRYEKSALKETVSALLNKIGEPCKTVLELFYLKGYALDSIAAEMNYKSENIASKRKFICLKQMRELLKENSINGEIKSI